MTHRVEWVDHKLEPRNPPDPRFPRGIDLDLSKGASAACKVALPYPAPRIGHYVITCETCGLVAACTTAGRPDDPCSVKLACRGH